MTISMLQPFLRRLVQAGQLDVRQETVHTLLTEVSTMCEQTIGWEIDWSWFMTYLLSKISSTYWSLLLQIQQIEILQEF